MMEMSNETKPTSAPPEYSGPAYPLPQVQYPQYGPAFPVQANPPPPIIWMPPPPQIPNCPRGLEYFSQLEVQAPLGNIIGYVKQNWHPCLPKFTIQNEAREMFLKLLHLVCLANAIRMLILSKALDLDYIHRFINFICCIFYSAKQFWVKTVDGKSTIGNILEVQAPLGNIIGYVKQNWHPCLPKFTIQNEARENVLKITAPCVPCQCYQDVNFEVKTVDGKSTIGNIVKKWTGLAREVATDASIFQIRFPMDLDINMKAIITGACFLMDFMFFERAGSANNQNRRRR
ncbi:putative Phospholipid scramblase protein [Naja naja]|nr:putative Phospholipid scramblase protein [Naja naja]